MTRTRAKLAPPSVRACVRGPLAFILALLATSCAGAAGSSRIEDKARRDVPIAICRKALTTNDTNESGAPRLETYWSVLFPSFRGFSFPMDSTARDCVGDPILVTDKAAPPSAMAIGPGDSTIAAGEDGIQAVWLRASHVSEQVSFGVLALVRPRPAELDVYSIGVYRGSSRHSRFEFAHIGTTTVLIARDEGCADAVAGAECESSLTAYLVAGGQLFSAGKTPTERVGYGTMKDLGRVQWRMTTDPPLFDAHVMRIKEKLSVRDAREDEVRKSENERVFTLRGTELVANSETLSSQVGK
jgi:hypothetical protein